MIDLHTHTIESDGEKTPQELIDLAISRNIEAIAITDHDTADGIEAAINYAKDKKIIFIPGIELDAKVSKGQMHILGLCINPNQEEFSQKLASIKAEMFDKYFNQSPLCKIKKSTLSGEEIIKLIKKTGGIAILAHPQNLKLTDSELVEKIAELKSYGLDGLECYHSSQTPEQMKRFKEIAEMFNLLITKGSDYHGPVTKPEIEIGTGLNGNIVSDNDKDIIENLLNYYSIQNKRRKNAEER